MKNILFLSLTFLITFILKSQELPIDLIQRANSVDYIFEGKVISQNSYKTSNRQILTSNTILISKILKGDIECGTIELITDGGSVENTRSYPKHVLNLKEGNMGIFLCSNSNKENSPIDFYLENNPEKIEASFQKQSYISYWWDGVKFNAADLFENFNDIALAYNAFELISGLTFTDCSQNAINNIFQTNNGFNVTPIDSFPVEITNIHPLNLAGGIKDTLYIEGYNFGSIKGEVYFKDADDGGVSEVFTNNGILWTDQLITIIVPSNISYDSLGVTLFGRPAGSGPVKIKRHSTNTSPVSIDTSSQILHIEYSPYNNSNGLAHKLAPFNAFNQKLTFHCTNELSSYKNGLMKDVIQKAIDDWVCLTGVDFEIGNDVPNSTQVIKEDTLCVIGFNSLSSNLLALSTPIEKDCLNSAGDWVPAVTEWDISIDSNQNWFLDTVSSSIPMNTPRYIDFYATILHEIGHCLLLNHTIDTTEIMHYSINFENFTSRNIDVINDLSCEAGAHWVLHNTNNPLSSLCDMSPISVNPNPACAQQFSIYEYNNTKIEYFIYPNPTTDHLFIEIDLTEKTNLTYSIYNVNGQILNSYPISAYSGLNKYSINIDNLNTGLYFLNIKSNDNKININQKIIKK